MEARRMLYADYTSSTPVLPEVKREMLPYLDELYANPSSLHDLALKVRRAVDQARERVAQLLGASAEEIIFTSGGAEANNLAIKGVVQANKARGRHVVVSAVEHYSIMHPLQSLAREGVQVTRVGVDEHGRVRVEELEQAIRDDTILISVQHANHEVGTLQPIKEVAEIAEERGITFHCDGVSSAGVVPAKVEELGVDIYTLSAHRFYGPKGAGALYVARGVRLLPLIEGGIQERGYRAGTENVPGIVGMGKAAELAEKEMPSRLEKLHKLRARFLEVLREEVPDAKINGHPSEVNPMYAHISVAGVEGETVVAELSAKGIYITSGSPCMARAAKASHVLAAMGLSAELIRGAMLFSLGIPMSEEEAERLAREAGEVIRRLRGG
ncbi:MAG: cysteine desulfurase [Euryarchaeota archaeon]|nr:cysteine desulfurase [Euryarchaeota archaeon]